MRRTALGATLVALCLGAFAESAAAAPQKGVWDNSFTNDPVSICPFTVYATGHQTGQVINFFDKSGALTRTQIHATEQLTLSANGRTLTAEPIHINLFVDWGPNGELEHVYLAGVVARIPLPNGTTFLSAGRLDFIARGVDFAVTPDVGRSGDVGALCAALS
jgi:hypothetical protein